MTFKRIFFAFLTILVFYSSGKTFSQNQPGSNVTTASYEVKKYEASQNVPPLLQGIWQGSDRLILFSSDDVETAFVLRVFYQWYDDRAAEAPRYAQLTSRDRNDASSPRPEYIKISFVTIYETSDSGVYELRILYPGQKEVLSIPLAVINQNLYMNFLLRGNAIENDYNQRKNLADSKSLDGYWRSLGGAAKSIPIVPPVISEELVSYLIDGDSFFHIRYWLSDMDYSYTQAEFSSDDGKIYNVDKYIQTAGKNYTCTTGRRSKIRNVEKSKNLPQDYLLDSSSNILAFGSPYLVKVPGGNHGDLQQKVEETNSKRKPAPKAIFPPPAIDFHWREISELEKYNPLTWNRRNIDLGK